MDGQKVMAPLPARIWIWEDLIDYIKNQQEHHRKKTFEEEYRSLLMESGLRLMRGSFP